MRILIRTMFPICALMAAPVFAAAPVLDQSAPVDPVAPTTWALSPTQNLIQSFTVGLHGRLAELDLPIGCASGEVILEIYDALPSGLPDTTALRLRRSYAANLFPLIVSAEFQPLPLGGRVGVNPGDRLTLVLSNPTGSCGIQFGIAGDPYLGGTGIADDPTDSYPGAPLILSGTDDLPFQMFVRLTGP
jgi:hypothetical protein